MAWIEPVTLAGAHVVLEPIAERHLGDLLAAGQDELVWAWLPWARPRSEAELAALLDSIVPEEWPAVKARLLERLAAHA
jgi:hypothetical protein